MPEPTSTSKTVEATAEYRSLIPLFATSIHLGVGKDAFILDFHFASTTAGTPPTNAIHLGRFAISPTHARALQILLAEQLALYDEKYPVTASMSTAASTSKGKPRAKKLRKKATRRSAHHPPEE